MYKLLLENRCCGSFSQPPVAGGAQVSRCHVYDSSEEAPTMWWAAVSVTVKIATSHEHAGDKDNE